MTVSGDALASPSDSCPATLKMCARTRPYQRGDKLQRWWSAEVTYYEEAVWTARNASVDKLFQTGPLGDRLPAHGSSIPNNPATPAEATTSGRPVAVNRVSERCARRLERDEHRSHSPVKEVEWQVQLPQCFAHGNRVPHQVTGCPKSLMAKRSTTRSHRWFRYAACRSAVSKMRLYAEPPTLCPRALTRA